MNSTASALLVAAAVAAVVEWVAVAIRHRQAEIVAKPLTTALLIGVATTVGSPDTTTRILIVVAAVFGLVGDVALLGEGESSFLTGLGAFAVGHGLYVAAALAVGLDWPAPLIALPFLAVLLGWRFLAETVPGARRAGGTALMGAVLGYAVIIWAMVVTATGTGTSWRPSGRCGLPPATGSSATTASSAPCAAATSS